MSIHASLIARDEHLTGAAHESAMVILRESRRMHQMVVNLLDISRAEEGHLEPKRAIVDLATLVRDVVEALLATANDYEVRLENDVPDATGGFSLDADLFRRVLENLVENGIRHARRSGAVRIEASTSADLLELRVIDSGPGVPEALRERIFDKYVQVESPSDSTTRGGRGLGLTFCRMAVEAHGGTIRVDPSATNGTFIVRIPRCAGAPQRDRPGAVL